MLYFKNFTSNYIFKIIMIYDCSFSPTTLMSNSTFFTYSCIASSDDLPFCPFHAAHLAFPLKSKSPGFSLINDKFKN